jgi:serine/threonine protein kinase
VNGKTYGQYRVIELMGGGGMGTVYRAVDEMLEREVALKVLSQEVDDPEKRFRAEAVAIARLRSPGIATVYELFQHDGQWVMVMELVRGETLEQIVDRIGPLPPKRAAEVCMQALTALGHAHRMGVVHRDLKPSNLMVAEDGAVKIMDFGIARIAGAERLTNDGFMMGTPAYMAPEQVLGHALDGRADLYSMGIVFYRLITGKLPYKGDTPYEMAQAHLKDTPVPVDLIKPDVPLWVKYVLDLALAKSPEQRFQSAEEFHAAFARALSETTGAIHRSGRTEALARSNPRTEPLARPVPAPVNSKPHTGKMTRRQAATRAPRTSLWTGVAATVILAGSMTAIWLQSPADAGAPPPAAALTSPPPIEPKAPTATVAMTPETKTASAVALGPKKPAATASASAPDVATVAAFSVKLVVVQEGKTTEQDVMLNFASQQLTLVPPNGGAPVATLPYGRIAKATYVRAREPRWDSAYVAPEQPLEVGMLARTRHWLTVQTRDSYVILRIDGAWQRVIEAFEVITARQVDRPLNNH